VSAPTKKAAAKASIMIVDDHPMMREGVAQLIAQQPDLQLVGQAGTAHEALDLVGKLKPRLLIADMTLPGKSGLELIKDMRAIYPETSVLVVSMHDETLYAERALGAGARGFVF
jgi:DNA-binding NarL/FixJ family response regulator